MSALLYIAGLIIGVTAFIYILSLLNDGKERLQGKTPQKKEKGKEGKSVEASPPPIETIAPGERMCPLCRTKLSRYEALYAARMAMGNEQKLMIYGCRYCYKDDEDPAQKKKSIV